MSKARSSTVAQPNERIADGRRTGTAVPRSAQAVGLRELTWPAVLRGRGPGAGLQRADRTGPKPCPDSWPDMLTVMTTLRSRMTTVTTSVTIPAACSFWNAMKACWPSPVSGLICAAGSGDLLRRLGQSLLGEHEVVLRVRGRAAVCRVAAANGWYACGRRLQHQEVRLRVHGEAALAVGAVVFAGRRPAGTRQVLVEHGAAHAAARVRHRLELARAAGWSRTGLASGCGG